MNTVDIIILICFVPAIWQGISKGFIDQVVGIAALILGVWLAFRFSSAVGDWLAGYITVSPQIMSVISFAVVAIVVMIVLNLLGKLVTSLVKMATLGWLNRLLGLAFSLAKAVLIIGLIITVFEGLNNSFAIVPKESLESSTLYCGIRDICATVFPYLRSLVTPAAPAAPANA